MVNAYTLTLAGFLLLGGSLGDHYGRRKVFVIGVIWFAVASLLCGLAPTDEALIAARALQGIHTPLPRWRRALQRGCCLFLSPPCRVRRGRREFSHGDGQGVSTPNFFFFFFF